MFSFNQALRTSLSARLKLDSSLRPRRYSLFLFLLVNISPMPLVVLSRQDRARLFIMRAQCLLTRRLYLASEQLSRPCFRQMRDAVNSHSKLTSTASSLKMLTGATASKKSLDTAEMPEMSKVTWSLYNLRGLSFVHILLLLSVFFQSMKPSDPYLPLFLDETHGLDTRIVTHYVFTWYTYAQIITIVPVVLTAEFALDYFHVVLFGVIARVASQFLLLYGSGLVMMQWCQAIFGAASATKIVTGAFLYQIVPKDSFHTTTGLLRAATLLSNVLAGLLGWMLRDFFDADYYVLFYITQTSMCAGLLFFLAGCKGWLSSDDSNSHQSRLKSLSMTDVLSKMRNLLSSRSIIIWSLWWWFGLAVHELVNQYDTTLFKEVDATSMKNGVVLALARLSAAAAAMLCGYSKRILDSNDSKVVVVVCVLSGSLLALMSTTASIYATYLCHIILLGIFEFALCSASAQIAFSVSFSMRLVILFLNTTISLIVQSITQLIIGPWCAAFDIRMKFAVFAITMFVLGAGVLLVNAFFLRDSCEQAEHRLPSVSVSLKNYDTSTDREGN